MAVVVRFKDRRTVDRNVVSHGYESHAFDVSKAELHNDPVAEAPPILLSSQIMHWNTQESKGSHASSAVFRVAPVWQLDRAIGAGDWIFFWAFQDEESYLRVLKNVRDVVANRTDAVVNGFLDGLRFVGRCNAPKESFSIDPATGTPSTMYDLTAVGFSELDSRIYYNQAYVSNLEDLTPAAQSLKQVRDVISNVDQAVAQAIPMTVTDHFRLWLQVFLGAGPGVASKGFDVSEARNLDRFVQDEAEKRSLSVSDETIKASLVQSPNETYRIPRTAARLLGLKAASSTYADALSTFIGIQSPGDAELSGDNVRFFPPGVDSSGRMVALPVLGQDAEPVPPSGSFRPVPIHFGDTSVWDLLSRFSNSPVNEMFTGLRYTSTGRVLPSLLVRQIPYTSKRTATALTDQGAVAVAFANLPRWVLSDGLVELGLVGASDSLRFNFVSVTGTDPVGATAIQQQVFANVQAPPMADVVDIQRNGLKTYVRQINSDVSDVVPQGSGQHPTYRGRFYTALLGDATFEQHLKWSGTVRCHGILEPVPVGDNLEYRDIIYQIEARQDEGSIDPGSGRKSWYTTFSVSSGISTATDNAEDDVYPAEAIRDPKTNPHTGISSDDRDLDIEGVLDFAEGGGSDSFSGPLKSEGTSPSLQRLI